MDEYANKLADYHKIMEGQINNIVAPPKGKWRSVNVKSMRRELRFRGEELQKKISEVERYVEDNDNDHMAFVALGDLHRLEMERMVLFQNPHYSNCMEVDR